MNKIMGKIVGNTTATPLDAREKAKTAERNAKSYTNKMIGDITALIHRDLFHDCESLSLPENCVRVKRISFTCVDAGTVLKHISVGVGANIDLPEEIKPGASVVLDAENNIATHDGTPFSAEPILSALKDGTATSFSYFNENIIYIENLCIEYYVSAKTYTDTSIQQAILDSWGCEV